MDLYRHLHSEGLYIIRSPGDGHCFLHALSTAFLHQLGTTMDLHTIKSSIFTETVTKAEYYAQFLVNGKMLLHYLHQYIVNKCYNTPLGDLLPLIIANALSVKLTILNQYRDTFQFINVSPPHEETTITLTLHRRDEHYNGVAYKSGPKRSPLDSSVIHRQQPRPVVNQSSPASSSTLEPDHGDNINQCPQAPSSYHDLSRNVDHSKIVYQIPHGSGAIHRQQPRPVDSHSGRRAITYSSERLRLQQPATTRVSRHTRKKLFACGIWKPHSAPYDSVDGVNPKNLTSVKKSSADHLIIGCVNARSIRNKTCDFHDNIVEDKYDICLVTETWMSQEDTVLQIEATPPGYTFQHLPRSDRPGGGVGLISSQNFKPQQTPSPTKWKSFEHCEWSLSCGTHKLLVVVVYRPPYSENNKFTVNDFLTEFSSYMESVITTPQKLLIGGDFNIHLENKSSPDSLKFSELLDTLNLKNHVWSPTLEKGHTLDLLITRDSDDIILYQPEIRNFLSDHAFVKAYMKINKPTAASKVIKFRRTKNIDMDDFKKDIKKSKLNDMESLLTSEKADLYDRTLSELLDTHAPLIEKNIKIKRTSPWYNNELRSIKRKKRKLERAWKKSRTPEDHHKFKEARSDYIKRCNEVKRIYYSNEIQKCGNDQSKLFKLIKHLTVGAESTLYPPDRTDQQLCEDFALFFIEKIDKIMNDIEDIIGSEDIPEMCHYSKGTSVDHHLRDFEILSTDAVMKLISKSKTKSSLLDPIPTALLKQCLDVLIEPITNIINSSLREGVFPQNWKTAIVTPLLKKTGLELIFKNFRPVSNLSYISKLVEKAGLSQYVTYLKKIDRFSSLNSAYKEKHSTETLLTKIHSDIINNMDSQKVTLLVLLDLSAAFDTVSLDILTDIFKSRFNISGNVLSWFRSYLQKRDQRVIINNIISSSHELKYGVPQGSCAGPVVFLGYLCSLYDIIKKHLPTVQIGGYADDHQLYLSYKPGDEKSETDAVKSLCACISEVRNWMLSHRLKINDTKTEFLLLGTQQQLCKVNIEEVQVGNSFVKPVQSLRNLGVVFDQNLNMSSHVNQICQKGHHQLKRIRQIRKYLDKPATEKLIHAFVTSNIDYCNALLYGAPKNVIGKLQKLQNSAAKVVSGARKYDHVTPILKELHWLPVPYRISFKIALLTYKCLNNMAPPYLKELIKVYEPQRNLRSSGQLKLVTPMCKTKTGTCAFTSSAPQVWNEIPEHFKKLDLNNFKKQLKTHYFKKAFPSDD